MNAAYSIQVGRRGVITFPKELRDRNGIADGEVLHLVQLSADVYVISRRRSRLEETAEQLAREWKDSGESLETMLAALKELRAEYAARQP